MASTRRGRGWRLTKASWRLARRDPTLVPLTLLAIGCVTLASFAVIGLLTNFDGSGQGDAAQILLVSILGGFLSTAILIFFSSALSHAASGGFDGFPLTMREALAEARAIQGPIALWSLIALAVTIVLQLLGATGDGGMLLSLLLGLAWAFFVTFVVPIMALAGAGAGEAISESAALARRRWGEQLSGGVAIFALTLLAAIGGAILCGIGSSAFRHDQDIVGALALVAGIAGLVMTMLLSAATAQAFIVALFRFDGEELSLDQLESPTPAAPIGRSAVYRFAGVLAGLLVAATLVGVLLPHHERDRGPYTPEHGWYYATFSPDARVPLGAGAPVVYEERRVGVVVSSQLEPGRLVVWFRADPSLEEGIEANPKTVGGFEGVHYLQVGPRDGPDSLGSV